MPDLVITEPKKLGDFATDMGIDTRQVVKVQHIAPVEAYRPIVERVFPKNEVDNALTIMEHESRGNTNAVSSTDDHGLLQINAPSWCNYFGVTREQLKNPELNISLSYRIWDRADGVEGNGKGNFRPWTTSHYLYG